MGESPEDLLASPDDRVQLFGDGGIVWLRFYKSSKASRFQGSSDRHGHDPYE